MEFAKPTPSELEILGIIWRNSKATVREVHEELSRTKETGYTTTLKLMQIMFEKGLVRRDESSKSHVYEAAVSSEIAGKDILARMAETLFGGSTGKLALSALGQAIPSREELDAIQELLDKYKNASK